MPLPPKVWKHCSALLQADETLQYLFPANSIGLGRRVFGIAPFIIAVSDKTVTVIGCKWLRRNRPASVWVRYPRSIRLGPVDTSLGPTFRIGTMVLETDEEYLAIISAADAEVADDELVQPDPLPDL